jgi:glycosyltransferase involved in cell wall biosynthesis
LIETLTQQPLPCSEQAAQDAVGGVCPAGADYERRCRRRVLAAGAGTRDEDIPPTRLRICVLAHGLRAAGGLSVGTNMVAALGRQAPQHTYLITVPPGPEYEEVCRQIPRCQTVACGHTGGLIRRLLYDTTTLRRLVEGFRPDVILALGNFGLLKPPCPQAVLLHQSYLVYPSKHYGRAPGLERRLRWRATKSYFARQLQSTQLVLCQTQVMERRLRAAYRYRGRTAICPNALSNWLADGPIGPEAPGPLRPHADRMKLLCLTRYYGHKNLETIVETFRTFATELEGVVVVLTVAPHQEAGARKLLRSIERLGLSNVILNVGPLPQSQLASYYRHCQALLLPTFLESFSGTYLEAMHFGVPILTSDLDFAHAVCGDAALYFDPWDAGAIKDAVLRLKNDPELARDLAARGRARHHTMAKCWDELARNVATLLAELAD